MLTGRATAEGTASYASRFPNLPGNFRPALGLSLSSIGIGTYLGEADEETDREYEAALKAALGGGINLVDTAVNYRFQRSERTIGKVLAELTAAGQLRREEVVLASKAGFITFDGELPASPRQWVEDHLYATDLVGVGDLVAGSHCMTPKYLAAMLELSRANLGVETIDIYYLHNPETQLEELERKEFLARIRLAFEFFERMVSDGKIATYGTATWNGFRAKPTERGWLSLDELVKIANQVAGERNHFNVIQLPYNLAMPEAVVLANQIVPSGHVTALAAAHAMGLAVCASAALLQGRLATGLPPIVGEAFEGFSSDAQRSIQFVRSTPGVDAALVGMKSIEHVRDTLATATRPPGTEEQLKKLFRRSDDR
ncbi:MAG TPA: aldo/keto reductase [Candidatus Binataceae bacterium]